MNKELLIAIIGGLGAMLGWGISDYFAKKSVDKVGHTVALFWMQAFGIIPLVIYFIFNPDFSGFSPSLILPLVGIGLIDVLGYILFYKSLEKGKVSIVSPITSSYSAFAVLISATLFRENLSPKTILILGIIFTGIILSSLDFGGIRKDGLNSKDLVRGVPEALLGVLFFSFWFPLWSNFVNGRNWLLLVILLRSVMSLFLLGANKIAKQKVKIESSQVFKWLIIIGALDALAYLSLTWSYGVTKYTSIISVLSSTFSIPTLILARIFLKEKIKPSQTVGIIIILIGLAFLGAPA